MLSDRASMAGQVLPPSARWIEIEPLRTIEAYSEFMLKALAAHISSAHVLVIQWDGFVLNAEAWDDAFLDWDYIGAPWPHVQPYSVGNGGFSLRSKRLLLALQEAEFSVGHPEDICICVTHREALQARGLRFAPLEVAERFAVEHGAMTPGVFGFHGPYHLPDVLDADATLAFVESLDTRVAAAHYFGWLLRALRRGAAREPRRQQALKAFERLIDDAVAELQGGRCLTDQALGFCKALIRQGQFAAAGRLLAQRRAASGRLEGRLWLRLKVNSLIALVTPRRSPNP